MSCSSVWSAEQDVTPAHEHVNKEEFDVKRRQRGIQFSNMLDISVLVHGVLQSVASVDVVFLLPHCLAALWSQRDIYTIALVLHMHVATTARALACICKEQCVKESFSQPYQQSCTLQPTHTYTHMITRTLTLSFAHIHPYRRGFWRFWRGRCLCVNSFLWGDFPLAFFPCVLRAGAFSQMWWLKCNFSTHWMYCFQLKTSTLPPTLYSIRPIYILINNATPNPVFMRAAI